MTYKTKNKGLVLGFIALLFLSYKLTIKKTFDLRAAYKQELTQASLGDNLPQKLAVLYQKEKYYDSLLNSYKLGGKSIQNNLLSYVSQYASEKDLKVLDFSEPHILTKESFTTKTYVFMIEGNYSDIERLVYLLEQETKFGQVININLEKKKNQKNGRDYLQAQILLRSFS